MEKQQIMKMIDVYIDNIVEVARKFRLKDHQRVIDHICENVDVRLKLALATKASLRIQQIDQKCVVLIAKLINTRLLLKFLEGKSIGWLINNDISTPQCSKTSMYKIIHHAMNVIFVQERKDSDFWMYWGLYRENGLNQLKQDASFWKRLIKTTIKELGSEKQELMKEKQKYIDGIMRRSK